MLPSKWIPQNRNRPKDWYRRFAWLGGSPRTRTTHRDIKPANILLNSRATTFIGDFGLVTDRNRFRIRREAGYYDHLAYEIWHGKGTSVRSDVWAFGATLFRLLHGKQWYEEMPSPKNVIGYGGFADGLKWLPHIPKKWRLCSTDDGGRHLQTISIR